MEAADSARNQAQPGHARMLAGERLELLSELGLFWIGESE
jgi:hypothetical protein